MLTVFLAHFSFHRVYPLTTILATKRNIYSPFSLFMLALLGCEQSFISFFESHGPRARVPCPPQPLFDSPQTSCGTLEAKVAVVYEKMDRTIPEFSGAVILPTSMKYKKVTDIHKAIHRILRKLLLTQSITINNNRLTLFTNECYFIRLTHENTWNNI